MPKYFREVNKHFSGDKTLAARYMGVARSLLGGLVEMSGDVFQNARSVLLPDGTKIVVSFAGAVANVAIDVRKSVTDIASACNLFMESGAVYMSSESLATFEEFPASALLVYGDDCRQAMTYPPVPLDYYGCKYSAESPHDSTLYSTGADDALVKSQYRYLLRNLSGANFTGLMRLFISAWLGSRPQDIGGSPSRLSTSRSLTLTAKGNSVSITHNTGIFRSDDDKFWMVDLGPGEARYWRINFGAYSLSALSDFKKFTGYKQDRALAYMFSDAEFGEVQTFPIPDLPAQPLAWGWKFNSDGSKADIVLCESGATQNKSWHYGLTISKVGDDTLSASLTTSTESDYFVLTSANMINVPNEVGVQSVSDFGRSEDFPATDGYDPYPDYANIPVYCFYRDSGLCLVTLSASHEAVAESVVTVGPADLSVQYLRNGLSKEIVTTPAYTRVTSTMTISTVGTYTGQYIGGNSTSFSEYSGSPNGGTRYWPGTVSEGVYCLGTTFLSWDMAYSIGTSSTGLTTHATTMGIPIVDAEGVYVGNRTVTPGYTRHATRNGNTIEMTFVDSCGNEGDAAGYVYQYTFEDPLPDEDSETVSETIDNFLFVGNRDVVDVGGNPDVIEYFYTVDNGLEERSLISWGGNETSSAYYRITDDVLDVEVTGGYAKPAGTEFINFIGWD